MRSNFVKTDNWMMLFGSLFFAGKNRDPSKIVNTVKAVQAELRKLSRLYVEFVQIESDTTTRTDLMDMFNHKHYRSVMKAINVHANKKEKLKHGLKLNCYYYLLNFFHGYFLQKDEKLLSEQL